MEISVIASSFNMTSTGAGGNYILFMSFVIGWIVVAYAFSGLSSVLSSIVGMMS